MVRPRQITDEQILEVARQMFFEHGPSLSTNAIAKELEISQASLFKRFGTKAALMRQAMRVPAHPAWTDLLADGPDASRPIADQLLEVAHAINAFFEEIAPAAVVMKMSGCTPDELFADDEIPTPIRGIRALTAWLEAARDQGRIQTDAPAAVAMALLGALHIRPFMVQMFGGAEFVDGPSYVRHVVDTHVTALTCEP